MKKHIILQTAIITFFVSLAMLIIIPVMDKSRLYNTAFALNDVVTEADCRMCHCYDVPDTHHQLVLSGTYECLNCHQIKWDDASQNYYTEVIRDCVVCHGNVVGDTHHVLVQAGTYECLDCHQMTFDNASQQYIVELNFTCISGQTSNQPPVADAELDQTVSRGQSVSFSGANSYDPDGSVVQYAWNFGDGFTGTGATTSHTYNSSGIYTVTLSVTDDKGAIGTDTAVITVNGVTGPVAAYTDEVLRFDNLNSYTDRDSYADIYNITSAFSDDSYSNSYRIRYESEEDNEAISMRINEEAGSYSQVVISIYVNSLEGSSESIRIYPYQSNANYLQTSYYLDKTVYGTGWVDIDVTSLISSMNGYGWMKFRIVNRSNWMYVSEGYFTLYGAAANKSPIANAGLYQTVNAGDTVSFNGTGSSDPDGSIVNYQWNFGDGYTGSGSTTTHAYNTPGTYTVILTVTDNNGATGTNTATIIVQAANQPPVANAGPDQTVTAGTTLSFSVSSSYDPDGTIISYTWSFGDGSTGTGLSASHTYTVAGTYTVTLIVIDNKGATGSDTAIVTVQAITNQPPVANAGQDKTVTAGDTVSFSGANSNDPDGTIASYAWNFGDGSTGTGVSASHVYTTAGTYTVTLTVTDNKGAAGSDTATITVNGVVPGPVAVYADEVLRFDNLDSYTYRDSNAHIYDITSAFSDNSYSNSYRIRYESEEDNEAISMRINEEAGRYSQVVISIYVNSLEGSSERIRIYPYRSNANYLQTSYYLDKTVYGTGWVDIDVTSLISSMNGYGWMKFRIVNRSNWMYASEGYFKLYGAAANESPIANVGSDQTVNAGDTVSFNGTGSSDPDGSIVNYQWNFGDGYTGSGSTTTHAYNTPGTYTVILTVTDDKGATGTDTAIITVQAAPVSTSVYASQVLWIQNLKYSTSSDSYGSKTDITSRFKDNILTDTLTIYNHSDSYKVISMKLNKDAGLYSQVMISLYVKGLYDNHSQTVKIYPYKSDSNLINTSYYSSYTISKTGWTQIDLTSLASKMKGFGWMKFRITCTSTSLDVAEGNFIVK